MQPLLVASIVRRFFRRLRWRLLQLPPSRARGAEPRLGTAATGVSEIALHEIAQDFFTSDSSSIRLCLWPLTMAVPVPPVPKIGEAAERIQIADRLLLVE